MNQKIPVRPVVVANIPHVCDTHALSNIDTRTSPIASLHETPSIGKGNAAQILDTLGLDFIFKAKTIPTNRADRRPIAIQDAKIIIPDATTGHGTRVGNVTGKTIRIVTKGTGQTANATKNTPLRTIASIGLSDGHTANLRTGLCTLGDALVIPTRRTGHLDGRWKTTYGRMQQDSAKGDTGTGDIVTSIGMTKGGRQSGPIVLSPGPSRTSNAMLKGIVIIIAPFPTKTTGTFGSKRKGTTGGRIGRVGRRGRGRSRRRRRRSQRNGRWIRRRRGPHHNAPTAKGNGRSRGKKGGSQRGWIRGRRRTDINTTTAKRHDVVLWMPCCCCCLLAWFSKLCASGVPQENPKPSRWRE